MPSKKDKDINLLAIMKKLTKHLLVLTLLVFAFASKDIKAHSVQVGYCVNCNGDLRLWVEHWHNAANPNTTTMTIQLQVGPNTININGSPDTSVQGVPIGQLPGCFTPMTVFSQCQGTGIYAPNSHNDWVAYDFPNVQCGVPINITVISGNSAFTDDCGNPVNMFPASSGNFTIPCATNQLPDDTICSGQAGGPYTFPAGNTWTNSNTAIGLPATGTGDVPAFTASNVLVPTTGNIVVTNQCGTSNFAITIMPGPIADFTAQVGCPGQPVSFTNNSTTTGPGPYTYIWDYGDGSPTYTGPNPPAHTYPNPGGPYNVTLSITTPGGCDSDTTIVVDPLSGAVANFEAPSVCDGSPSVFTDLSTPTGNILSWAWDFDNNGTVDDITQNPSHTFPGPGTYNVKLAVQVAGGCSDSIIIPVVVNPNPVANFTGTSECLGTVTTFNDLSNIATGGITNWFWDFGDPNTTADTSNIQNPTYTYPSSGTYTVTLTVTSDSGCTHSYNTTVDVFSHPVANFSPTVVCAGNNTNFMDMTTIGSAGIQTWSWDFDNDNIGDDNSQNPVYIFPSSGTFPVSLSVVDSNGCSHDTTISVTVATQPTADYMFTYECFGTATNFTDLSQGNGSNIVSWEWDFDNNGTVDNSTQNPLNGFPAAGTYTTELLITTDSGCVDSITYQVVVNPIPVANFGVNPVCFGETSMFYDSSQVATGNVASWQWDFGDALGSSNLQNPTYVYGAAGTYPVTLTVTSDSGCINTYIDTAVVDFLPTASFTTNNVCLNQLASFLDTSNPNGGTITSWDWDFDNDNVVDDTNQHPTNLFPTSGTYNVSLAVSTIAGCADTIVQPIEIYPMPVADFNYTNECYGTPITFTDNSSVITGNITNWDWDFGNANTSIAQNPAENYASDGIYTVVLVATTNNGCKDTVTKQVEVYPIPVANFGPEDVCLNFPTQFADSTYVNNANSPNNIASWNWDFGDGIGTSVLQNPIYIYNTEGTFPAHLTVVSNHGCTHDTIINVTVHPLPVVDFGEPASGCSPVCVTFTNNSAITAGVIANWQWDFGDGSTSGDMTPSHCFINESHTSVANFDVTLTATSDKGCVTTLTKPSLITSYPIPSADFTFGPQPTDIYDSEISFTDQSIIGSVWDWDFGDGGLSTEQHPTHNYADSGTYQVVLYMENSYGCRDTATREVRIKPTFAIWIPNVFTPDGDGVNDYFFANGYGIDELQTLVFDRWGVLVYEGYQLDSKWNGIYKGKMSIEDVYVYKIRARDIFGEWHEFVDKVTLLK
jgi:gliding motility-associated-like protein